MDRKTALLGLIAALATSSGFWQFLENRAQAAEAALYREKSMRCGESYVGLANAVSGAVQEAGE